MSDETPVDFDDASDPDCPRTAGAAIMQAVCFTNSIKADIEDDVTIFIWQANAEEQLETALADMGWKIERSRPWKKAP